MPIPRILHQGWIGDTPMPAREKSWCDKMRQMNPDWKHQVFGNEILERYGRDPYVAEMLNRGTAKAFIVDRIRCLLLRDEGGVWLDPDCQPIRPLKTLDAAWNDPRIAFVHAYRSARRSNVALHRGITFIDNTFLASAKDSRLINRVLEIWTPSTPVNDGHAIGVQIVEYAEVDTLALNYRYFYALQAEPDTICLHDKHNLGSWTKQPR